MHGCSKATLRRSALSTSYIPHRVRGTTRDAAYRGLTEPASTRLRVCESVLFLTGMLGFDIACCFEEKRAGDWSGNPVITATPSRDANATRNDLVLAA